MKIASRIRRTGSVAATVLVLVSLLVSGHTPVAAQTRVAWTGVFTGVVVPKPEPALDDYTRVYFNVSRPLNDSSTHGAELRMFAGDSYIGKCNSGTTCSLNANPAPGTSITYHAEVWVLRAGEWVKSETSQSVTVTDPGWTGSFVSADAGNSFPALGDSTTVRIYPRHVDPAVWTGKSKFYDSEDVRSLICESLGEHLVHDETGSNGLRARSYEMPREIGARNGVPTRFITVVTRPDGAVHTAYPGLPTGLTA